MANPLFNKDRETLSSEFRTISSINSARNSSFIDECIPGKLWLCKAPDCETIGDFWDAVKKVNQVIALIPSLNREKGYYNYLDMKSDCSCCWLYSITKSPTTLMPSGIRKSTYAFQSCLCPKWPTLVTHYQCVDWRDGKACSNERLSSLAKMVLNHDGKTLIHCLAGEGRSGTLAATVLAAQELLKGNLSEDILLKAAITIRTRRAKAIHTFEQYESIYKALKTFEFPRPSP
jgi:protein tyrosine phosphatase